MTAEALSAHLYSVGVPDDLVQEVMVRFLKAQKPIRHPKSWAYKCVQRLKIDASRLPPTEAIPQGQADSGADPARILEARTRLAYALTDENPILTLRALGYTYQEIASDLGIPLGTVMSRLHYARKRLKALR